MVLFKIAKTHLVSRKKQTITAALGVTFGIASFIILMSFMNGLNQMLDDLILKTAPHIHIYNEIEPSDLQPLERLMNNDDYELSIKSIKPQQTKKSIHNAIPLMKALQLDPQIKGAAPLVSAQVFYLEGEIELNGLIKGIDVKKHTSLFSFEDYLIDGNANDLRFFENGIVVGAGVAEKMSLKIGDNIRLATTSGTQFLLKVVGIYQSGLAELDNTQSFTNIATAQKLIGQPKTYITDIYVRMIDPTTALAKSNLISKKYKVHSVDFRTANSQLDTGTSIRNLISYAVSFTLLLVAGFGIYNILNMLIYEKMNDIAILKAVGFSGDDVKKIFLLEAMIIGLIGGLLGLVVGGALSFWIDNLPFETQALPTIKTYPVLHNPFYYVFGMVFALVSTFFAGYLPALKAKQIDPVDIIRGQ